MLYIIFFIIKKSCIIKRIKIYMFPNSLSLFLKKMVIVTNM